MSAQPPSAIEIEFARRYDQEHARVCVQVQPLGLAKRLTFWRADQVVRNALKVAGEPGLILEVACGAGRFWPVLAEHGNRVILACDPSQDMLNHAQTHHSQAVLKRVKTFQSSAFSIGLSSNAVDCIFCMQLFQHLDGAGQRLAMLEEFHRVSRDTVIVAVRLEARFRGLDVDAPEVAVRQRLSKAQMDSEFKQAGFRLISYQDFLPGCMGLRVCVLRKDS